MNIICISHCIVLFHNLFVGRSYFHCVFYSLRCIVFLWYKDTLRILNVHPRNECVEKMQKMLKQNGASV